MKNLFGRDLVLFSRRALILSACAVVALLLSARLWAGPVKPGGFASENNSITGIIAWIGTFSYLLAYILLCLGKLKPGKVPYHLLNVMGALGLIVHAVALEDHQNLIVNITWALVGITTIFFILRKQYRS